MTAPSVDQLRQQLRDLGYLTHGIERWFALDPWSSRTFWSELLTVSAKASLLSSIFAALPLLAITILRNRPLSPGDALVIGGVQAAGAFISLMAMIVLVALGLRRNPALAIDSPALLTGVTLFFSGGLSLALVVWWSGFDGPPSTVELAAGGALVVVFFLASSVVISAALLSFSIHEAKRIPAVHSKDRTMPMTLAAIAIACAIGAWSFRAAPEQAASAPASIAVAATDAKIALIAVDGLTHDILETRRDDFAALGTVVAAAPLAESRSAAERWATVGTGTGPSLHGVHAIEGVRLATSGRVLQSVSRHAFAIDAIAAPLGLASRVPLPPTARKRAYAWELLSGRGISSVAVNWWVTGDAEEPALRSVSQEALFARVAEQMPAVRPEALAIAIDAEASRRLDAEIARRAPRVATVFLPALDIVLNRIELDPGARLAASATIVDGIVAATAALRARGYDVILVGLPGEGQSGDGVIATTLAPSGAAPSIAGVAPTLLNLCGFPVADDMQGRPFAGATESRTIPSYGERGNAAGDAQTSEEYYESLRSLGYIR